MLHNHHWNSFKLFATAIMHASVKGHAQIVKLLLGQKGIDVNAGNIYLLHSMFAFIM